MALFVLMTIEEIQAELGQRIQVLRLARNITQEELGARVGLSRSTIRKLETSGQVTLEAFVRVLGALGRSEELESVLLPRAPVSIAALKKQSTARQRAGSKGKSS
jgi:transcriptional regulator with XRE-family HTH domain